MGLSKPSLVGYDKEARKERKELNDDKFTVVITTYRRPHSLAELVDQLKEVRAVDRVLSEIAC